MAASKSAVMLEEMVQCVICFEVLDKPGTLKCFHSFCTKCIKGFKTQFQKDKEVYSCPVCRCFTTKERLKSAHILTDLLELYWLMKSEEKPCSKCKKQLPKWRCMQCKSNCCDDCKLDHDFFPMLKHHKWVSFDDDEHALSIDKVIYCPHHSDKLLELVCKKCDQLICYLCKALHHEGHPSETIEQALERIIPITKQKQNIIHQNISDKTKAISKIQNEMKDIEKWFSKVQTRIDQQAKNLVKKIKTDHASLTDKAKTLKEQELKQYKDALETLEFSVKEEQNIVKWTDNTLTTASGTSLLQELQAGIKEQLSIKAEAFSSTIVKPASHPAFHVSDTTNSNWIGRIDDINKVGQKVDIKLHLERDRSPVRAILPGAISPAFDEDHPQDDPPDDSPHKVVVKPKSNTAAVYEPWETQLDRMPRKTDEMHETKSEKIKPGSKLSAATDTPELKTAKLLPIQLGQYAHRSPKLRNEVELSFSSSSFTLLDGELYFSEYNSNCIHIFKTNGEKLQTVVLNNDIQCRAIAVAGMKLVLASRQGLYLTDKTGSFTSQILQGFYMDVVTNDQDMYALKPGKVSVLHGHANIWVKSHEIILEDFASKFPDTSRSFHLQVDTSNSCLFVSSWKSRIIQQYTIHGEQMATYAKALTSQLSYPAICGLDEDGHLLVADRQLGLLVLNRDGSWHGFTNKVVKQPQYAVVSDSNTICVLTSTNQGFGNLPEFTCYLKKYSIE